MVKEIIRKYSLLSEEFGLKFSLKLLFNKLISNTNSVDKTIDEELLPFYASSIFDTSDAIPCNKLNAWSLWWQGEDSMPEMVKICYKSQLKYVKSVGIDYHLLTKDNIANFITIPSYLLDKVEKGQISLTHLSDVIRILLLEKYGGVWLDVTLLFVKPINKDYLNREFFSININPELYHPVGFGQEFTECKWASFFLATSMKHSLLFKYLKEAELNYWQRHSFVIDYFMTNRFIKLAYVNNTRCKTVIDQIPQSNVNIYRLLPILNSNYDVDTLKKLQEDTTCFKLSYKKKFVKNVDGKITFYGYLCNTFPID